MSRYQSLQFFLHILSAIPAGIHMLSLVTVAAVPDHRCFIPELDSNVSLSSPGGLPSWNASVLAQFLPLNDDSSINCLVLENSTHVPCNRYVYDTSYYQSSKAMEWDFVCDARWKGALAQSVYMLGVVTGAFYLGGLSDKYGRKTIFYLSAVMQTILGIGAAFTPNYSSFVIVRYFYGIFASAGCYMTGFVLTVELVGSKWRTICGITFPGLFAGGIMLVAGWASIIKDADMLQLVYGLHGLILITHWWIMDESPRWLWSKGRFEEAIDIVAKGVKMNEGRELDKVNYLSKGRSTTNVFVQENSSLSDIFHSPNLRRMALNVCFNWFANSIVYYGLSLGAGGLPGNPYLNIFLSALVEIPSYIAAAYSVDKIGRRATTSFLMLSGGVCCVVAAQTAAAGRPTATTVVMLMGKLFIAGSFAIIYNYTAELFPTSVRNSAVGLGSMCALISAALTPMITLLDSFDPKVPVVIFGVVAILSGWWTLFLPETMDQPIPETLEDGERLVKGDTFFTALVRRKQSPKVDDERATELNPLRTVEK